jgi:hypothetical protein
MSLLTDLRCAFMYFLWLILPKKYELIREIKIPYLRLPAILLGYNPISPDYRDAKGVSLYHEKSGKNMIFVAGTDQFLRCTIYHEHCEGEGRRQRRSTDEIIKFSLEKFPLILEVYRETDRTVPTDNPVFQENLRKWAEFRGHHFEALLKEIEFAKEELPQEKINLFFEDIKKSDRFLFEYLNKTVEN